MASGKPACGAGVLTVALCQLAVGIILLGLFEAFKIKRIRYFDDLLDKYQEAQQKAQSEGKAAQNINPAMLQAQAAIGNGSPMGIVWWLSIVNNTFAICGIMGVMNVQRDLVTAFFAWSAVQAVTFSHFFVDIVVDTTVKYGGEPPGLTGYEKATAAFLFIQLILAVSATSLAMKAMSDIKARRKEEYHRILPLSTLHADVIQSPTARP